MKPAKYVSCEVWGRGPTLLIKDAVMSTTSVRTWIASFLNRMTETREMDQLVQRLSNTLEHPCYASVLDALKNSWQSMISGQTDSSTRWAQVVEDFSWEMLNVGNWKDVSVAWRELYSAGALLKALNFCVGRDLQAALREIDKGIILGAPLFDNALPSLASLLNNEIMGGSLEGRAVDSEAAEASHLNGHLVRSCRLAEDRGLSDSPPTPHEAMQLSTVSIPRRKVVFKNYLPFQGERDKDATFVSDRDVTVGGGDERSFDSQRHAEAQMTQLSRARAGVEERHHTSEQSQCSLPRKIPIVYCPNLESFINQYMTTSTPVILSGCMDQWPAYAAKKWSLSYLKLIAGSRTVPVELGSRYTDEDWSQKLMTLSEFIDRYVDTKADAAADPKGYLAQHQLFDQIPELSHDFSVPEYCYLSSGRSGASSDVKVNAWFGPKGTLSPLHFDPDHNLLSQVVGRKHIRLYGEDQSAYLYPHDGILSNTSQVDVESPDLQRFPLFSKALCMECVLYPGHMLYIPPRCWHHVRSLDISFSVSFWWT